MSVAVAVRDNGGGRVGVTSGLVWFEDSPAVPSLRLSNTTNQSIEEKLWDGSYWCDHTSACTATDAVAAGSKMGTTSERRLSWIPLNR